MHGLSIAKGDIGVTYYRNRLLCEVFDEMRTCTETLNFGYLKGLIEEAQHMGSRMESCLEDEKDYIELSNDISDLRKERTDLREEIGKLKKQREGLS